MSIEKIRNPYKACQRLYELINLLISEIAELMTQDQTDCVRVSRGESDNSSNDRNTENSPFNSTQTRSVATSPLGKPVSLYSTTQFQNDERNSENSTIINSPISPVISSPVVANAHMRNIGTMIQAENLVGGSGSVATPLSPSNAASQVLYHNETLSLMHTRWSKLYKDFKIKNKKADKDGNFIKDKFDLSKVPDIYDCIKYSAFQNLCPTAEIW